MFIVFFIWRFFNPYSGFISSFIFRHFRQRSYQNQLSFSGKDSTADFFVFRQNENRKMKWTQHKSEDTGKIIHLRHKYSKSLCWAENLNKLFNVLGGKIKFSFQDSDLEYLCKNTPVSFDLKPPLVWLIKRPNAQLRCHPK